MERAIQSVVAQVRVLRGAREAKWNAQNPQDHPVWGWFMAYAAFSLNRFEMGNNGRTAYERSTGEAPKLMSFEFGEAIYWKRKRKGNHRGKLTCMWSGGMYLGVINNIGRIHYWDGARSLDYKNRKAPPQ